MMSRKVLSGVSLRMCANVLSRTKGGNFSLQSSSALRAGCHSHWCNNDSNIDSSFLTSNVRNHTSPGYIGQRCCLKSRCFSTRSNPNTPDCPEASYIDATDSDTFAVMQKHMTIVENFITEEEEQEIFKEIEPYLKRLKYQASHWDDAIHEYRETERRKWTEKNTAIIQRVRDIAFPPGAPQLAFVHVLDLKKEGLIKPHVDAVKFCGSTIAGISLLSTAVMRLVYTEDKAKYADILMKQRSLYIMKDDARYQYTHEVLGEANSYFRGEPVPRDRRISVICRNEPET